MTDAQPDAEATKPEAAPEASASSPIPARTWAKRLERYRPGLVAVRPRRARRRCTAAPAWERRLDPTSELILTILTQNSADTNAEVAFEALREAYPVGPARPQAHNPGAGWGGVGLPDGRAAGLGRGRVRATPRAGRRHPAGRPRQPEGAADPGDAPARSARSAATTRSSSSATCPRSRRATG